MRFFEMLAQGGFIGYGLLKSDYLLVKGSLAGATKRLVRLVTSRTPNHKLPGQSPVIESISTASKQG